MHVNMQIKTVHIIRRLSTWEQLVSLSLLIICTCNTQVHIIKKTLSIRTVRDTRIPVHGRNRSNTTWQCSFSCSCLPFTTAGDLLGFYSTNARKIIQLVEQLIAIDRRCEIKIRVNKYYLGIQQCLSKHA